MNSPTSASRRGRHKASSTPERSSRTSASGEPLSIPRRPKECCRSLREHPQGHETAENDEKQAPETSEQEHGYSQSGEHEELLGRKSLESPPPLSDRIDTEGEQPFRDVDRVR